MTNTFLKWRIAKNIINLFVKNAYTNALVRKQQLSLLELNIAWFKKIIWISSPKQNLNLSWAETFLYLKLLNNNVRHKIPIKYFNQIYKLSLWEFLNSNGLLRGSESNKEIIFNFTGPFNLWEFKRE